MDIKKIKKGVHLPPKNEKKKSSGYASPEFANKKTWGGKMFTRREWYDKMRLQFKREKKVAQRLPK